MATSETAIANAALSKLGARRISSIDDENNEDARTIRERFAAIRDAELNRHVWRFAVTRAELAASGVEPDFGYAYQYALPPDCLRLLSVGAAAPGLDMAEFREGLDAEDYTIEGQHILTDYAAPLKIRYVRQVTAVGEFTAAFSEALASRIAYEVAYRVSDSQSGKETAFADYKQAIKEAISSNALQLPPQRIPDNSWIAAHDQS